MAKTKTKGKGNIDSDDSSNEEEFTAAPKASTAKGSSAGAGGSAYDKVKAKWIAEECYGLAASSEGGCRSSSLPPHTLSTGLPGSTVFEWLRTSGVLSSDGGSSILPLHLRMIDGRQLSVNPLEASVVAPSQVADRSGFDLFINTGGPVWATSVFPHLCAGAQSSAQSLFDVLAVDKYIAIGVSAMGSSLNGSDKIRMLGDAEKGDNLLQIWRVSGWMKPPAKAAADRKIRLAEKKKKKGGSEDPNHVPKPKGRPRKYPRTEKDEQRDRRRLAKAAQAAGEGGGAEEEEEDVDTGAVMDVEGGDEEVEVEKGVEEDQAAEGWDVGATLVYCVSLPDRGPTWAAEWCPAPVEAEVTSSGGSAVGAPTLGLLAVVNGDGTCTILQLPRPISASAGGDPGQVPVYSEESVRVAAVSVPKAMICSVAWSPNGSQFCCGMSDGSVTVWAMSDVGSNAAQGAPSSTSSARHSAAVSLSRPLMHLVDTQQAESQIPCMAAVRVLQYCPYDASLLLAAGQDDVKIWSLRDLSAPAFTKKAAAPAVAACWDACGFGYYTGDCESTGLLWNPLWGGSFPLIHRRELYTHAHTYGAIWGVRSVRSDDQSLVLSAASDGTVRGGYSSMMTAVKNKNTSVVEYCKVLSARRGVVDVDAGYSAGGSSGGGGGGSNSGSAVRREALVIELDEGPRLLPVGVGADGLSESSALAWQCLDLVDLTGRTAAAIAGASGVGAIAQGKVGKAKSAQPERASLALAVYGGSTGLVRVQCIDPLRELCSSQAAPT